MPPDLNVHLHRRCFAVAALLPMAMAFCNASVRAPSAVDTIAIVGRQTAAKLLDVCSGTCTSRSTRAPVILASIDGVARWSSQTLPAGTSTLDRVDCPSTTVCEVTGQKLDNAGPNYLDIAWTSTAGKSWVSTVPSDQVGEMIGLDCTTTTTCEVGGMDGYLGNYRNIVGQLDTTTNGKLTHSEPVPGQPIARVEGMSCPSSRFCVAVGTHFAGLGPVMTNGSIYTTDDGGAHWATRALPSEPAGKNTVISVISGVSCASTADCVAVGQWAATGAGGGPGFGGFAISTTDGGLKWSIDQVPAGLASINAVSCLPTGPCVADGNLAIIHLHGEGTGNGTVLTGATTGRWTVQKVAGGSYELSGIGCITGLCVAVGTTARNYDEIIYSTDGGTGWSPVSVPLVANQGLSGVSCASKLVCIAVG